MLQGKSSVVFIDAKLLTATNPADFQVLVKNIPIVVFIIHIDLRVHHQVRIVVFAVLADLVNITIESDQSHQSRVKKKFCYRIRTGPGPRVDGAINDSHAISS